MTGENRYYRRGRSGDLHSLRHGPRDKVKGIESALLFTYFLWEVDILPNMSSSQAQGAPQHQGSLPTFMAPAANPDAPHPQSVLQYIHSLACTTEEDSELELLTGKLGCYYLANVSVCYSQQVGRGLAGKVRRAKDK